MILKAQPILSYMTSARKGVLLSVALLVLSFLNACSGGFGAAPYAFDVGVDPNPLGFGAVVDQDTGVVTYTIPSHTLTFASSAGAVGATIEGYEVEYFEASQNSAFPGDSVQRSRSSLNVYVPPGIVCPEAAGGDEGEETSSGVCTVNSPSVVFARGEEVVSQATTMIPIDTAIQLYNLVMVGGAVGAYAEVTFYGTDDLQRGFESEPHQLAIQIPLGGAAGGGDGGSGDGGSGDDGSGDGDSGDDGSGDDGSEDGGEG